MPGGLICEMETFHVIDFFSSVKDSCKGRGCFAIPPTRAMSADSPGFPLTSARLGCSLHLIHGMSQQRN